jgi:hypothetical protein
MNENGYTAQLYELANELQKAAPKGSENPSAWMLRAKDFADACLVDGRLSQQLHAVVQLKERGDFTRHIKTIEAASGMYNTGLQPGINNSLAFIVKALNQKVRLEPKYHFSMASIPELTNKLTSVQKNVFDEVWNFFVVSGNPFPIRSLPRITGKQSIQEAFDGLNGSLIYEKSEQEGRCLELTVYGAFLTGYGSVLASLLVRLLDLIKALYENDSYIKTIDGNQIRERLDTSDAETKLLFKLLRLNMPPRMPFHLSGWSGDGSSWAISITDEVIELFRSEDSVAYLDERLSAGYKPDEPCLHDDRLRHSFQNNSLQSMPDMFATMADQNLGQKLVHHPFCKLNLGCMHLSADFPPVAMRARSA